MLITHIKQKLLKVTLMVVKIYHHYLLIQKLKNSFKLFEVEYGKIKSPQKENEFSKNKILSNYGEAKLMSTKFLLDLNKKFNFPSVIVRLYLVYGPTRILIESFHIQS